VVIKVVVTAPRFVMVGAGVDRAEVERAIDRSGLRPDPAYVVDRHVEFMSAPKAPIT
jgi:hypothetical protein